MRKNRGKSAEDEGLFGLVKELDKLRIALEDMNYLLSRGYAAKSSLELVARKYRFKTKQTIALQGMSCAIHDVELRNLKQCSATQMKDKKVYIDGFNQLILLESLLSGAYVFKGTDGVYRDTSSIYGNYRLVNQTEEALFIIGTVLKKLEVKKVVWVFDAPVSNSGKLKTVCHKIAEVNNFDWEVILEMAPDKYLSSTEDVVVTSDALILNQCHRWFNLFQFLIENENLVDLNVINIVD